jgi:vacuolar-type H+-ATPase subunit H
MAKVAAGGRKSNELQYEEKMVRVFELIVYEKKSFTEFRDIASKEFEVTTRTAESMWTDCRNRLKERFSQEREEILSEQLNRLYDLLNRSRIGNNKRVEAEVLRDISKIYGLDQPVKMDITSGGNPITISINLDQ